MKLTNDELEIFIALFERVCDYKGIRLDSHHVKLRKIQIESTETVRHRFLIYLLVHNELKNFLAKRLKWINKQNQDIQSLTSNLLNKNISSINITFFWDDPVWIKFFRSFSNLFAN